MIYLILSLLYLITFLGGRLIEKIRVPWIFSALFLGFIFSLYNPFPAITSSDTFRFLASLGMYFLLFIIGFEIDIKEIKRESGFLFVSTLFIILSEGLCGMLLIHLLFQLNWFLSFLVGLSFATVGEAVLLPILDEFKIINTKLGQSIIGIGVLDDIFEIFTLVLAISMVGISSAHPTSTILGTLISLILVFGLTYFLSLLKKEGKKFKVCNIETLFLFTMFIFFLFLGIGNYADIDALAALLAGVALKNFIPEERLKFIESEIRSVCYGLFAPLFFFWVGITTSLTYLSQNSLILLIFFLVPFISKLIPSYLVGRKKLGKRDSFLLGIGLSVRFSTSIVILKFLFEHQLIPVSLYSVLIASTALFTLLIPISFAWLLQRWKRFIK